jgi:hypothetical protein
MHGVFVNVEVAGQFNVHDYSTYHTFFFLVSCFLRFVRKNCRVHTDLDYSSIILKST